MVTFALESKRGEHAWAHANKNPSRVPLLQLTKNESSLEDWEEVHPITADIHTFPQSTEEAAPQFIRRTKAMLSHSAPSNKSHITLPVTMTFEKGSQNHANFVPQINEELSSCFSQMSIDWEHAAQLLNSAISPLKKANDDPPKLTQSNQKKETKSLSVEPTIPVKSTPLKKARFMYISNTGSPLVPSIATPIKSARVDPAIAAIFESSTLVSPCKKQVCRPSQRIPRRVSLVKLADNCSLNFVKSPSPTSAREMGRKLFSGKHDWSNVETVGDGSTDTTPKKNKTAVKAQSITSWKNCLKNLKDYPFFSINQQKLKIAETSNVISDRFTANETSGVSPESVFLKEIAQDSDDETTGDAKKIPSVSQMPIDNPSDSHIFKTPSEWAVPESAVKPFLSPAKQPLDLSCPRASISDTYQSSISEFASKISSNNSPKNTFSMLADSVMGNIQSFVDTTGEETLDFEAGDDITSYKHKNVMIGYGKEFLDEGEVFSSDEEGELKIINGEKEEEVTVSMEKRDTSMSSDWNKILKQERIIQTDLKLSNTLVGTTNPEYTDKKLSETKKITKCVKSPSHVVTTTQSKIIPLVQLPYGSSELTPLHSIEDVSEVNMRLGHPSELAPQNCSVRQALICEDALSNPDSLTSSVNDFPEMRASKLNKSDKVCRSSKVLLCKDSLVCSSSSPDRTVPPYEHASNVTLAGKVTTEDWIAGSQIVPGELASFWKPQTNDISSENAIDPASWMEFHPKTLVAGQQPRRRLSLHDYVTRKKAQQSGNKQLNENVASAAAVKTDMAATLNFHHLIPIHVPPIEFTYLRRVPVIQDMLINEIVNGVNFGGFVSQNLLPSRAGGRWTTTNQPNCDKDWVNDKKTWGSVRRGKIDARREEEDTVIENGVPFDDYQGKDQLGSHLSTSCVLESNPPQQWKKVNGLPESLDEESSDFFHMVCIPKVKRVTDTYMSDQTILDSYGTGGDAFEVGKLIRRSITSADGNDIREFLSDFPRSVSLSSKHSNVGQASSGNEEMTTLEKMPHSPTFKSKLHIQHSSKLTLPLSVGKYAIKDMPYVSISPGSIDVTCDDISGKEVEVPVVTSPQSRTQDQTQPLDNINSVNTTVMEQKNDSSTPQPLHMVSADESYTALKSLSSSTSSVIQGQSIKSRKVATACSSSYMSEGTTESQYSKEASSSESIRLFLLDKLDATPKESIFTRRRKQQMESSVIGKRERSMKSVTPLAEVVATDLKSLDQIGKEQNTESKGYSHIKGKSQELGKGFLKIDQRKQGQIIQKTRKRRKTDSPDKGVTDLRSLLKHRNKNPSNSTSTGKPHCKRSKNSGKGDFISIVSDFRGQLFDPVEVLRINRGVKDLTYDSSKSCETLNEWLDKWRELAEPRIRELADMRHLLFEKNNSLPLSYTSMKKLTKQGSGFGWKESIPDSTYHKRMGLVGVANCVKTVESFNIPTTARSVNPLLKRREIYNYKKKGKVLAPKVWEESLEITNDADSVKQKRKGKNVLDFMIGEFNC
eukprot:sb/3460858/